MGLLLGVLGLLAAGAARPARADEAKAVPVAGLAWTDLQGHRYGTADLERAKATVFFFSSTQCPIASQYTQRMIELAREYTPRGVRFFLVDSNHQDSRADLARYVKERAFPFPAVKDEGTALADRLGAQATPEAIIVDRAAVVRYLGRIDDNPDRERVARRDAREALEALLADRPVPRSRTLPLGCAIFRDRPSAAPRPGRASVTYTRDVARILNERCVACHRHGEVAPFALETYAQARAWAASIKEYTARRLMPPWKPVAGHGDFQDERGLTDGQIATLAAWADAGAPEGSRKDLPPAPRFAAPGSWTLGTPDQVLQPVRAYHLEAEGKDVYRNFVLPIDVKEDQWLSGVEFQPDNRAVVHHMVLYLDPTGRSAQLDGKETEPGYTVPGIGIGVPNAEFGEVWVPGSMARRLPPGVAVKVPAGAKLVLQVHYHKSGKPDVDRSRAALYFIKTPVEKQLRMAAMGNVTLLLPPGDDHHEVRTSLTLPFDVHAHSIFPHMHMLGREMKVTATLPDGTVKPLIWIRDWDFNWQATYYFKEPVALPKGTKIDLVAAYDNSEKNPRQTAHPPREVRFGEQTTDEMCFCFFGLTLDGEKR
jgi:hypothetical protein